MKNLEKIFYVLLAGLILASCEDFLDTESYTKKNTGNFPQNQSDAEQMINGIYSCLNKINENPMSTSYMIAECAADDRFGGGGTGRSDKQGYDHLMRINDTQMDALWQIRYAGIYRANFALETLDNVMDWETKMPRMWQRLRLIS